MNIHDITGNTALCAQIYIQFATEEHKDHLRYTDKDHLRYTAPPLSRTRPEF